MRLFGSHFVVPKVNENFFFHKSIDRTLDIVENPESNVDKEICTPIVIHRIVYETLLPMSFYYQIFWVNMQDPLLKTGPTVLNLLDYIKNNLDSSLSYRKSCGTGLCGICAINVNGVNCLSCTAPVTPGTQMVIRQLNSYAPISDLIVNLDKIYNVYRESKPWLVTRKVPENGKENLQSPEDRKKLDGSIECTLCGCCNSSCPTYWWSKKEFYLGPAMLLQAYRWINDSRDEDREKRLETLLVNKQTDICSDVGACKAACPIGLDPQRAIEKLRPEVAELGSRFGEWK